MSTPLATGQFVDPVYVTDKNGDALMAAGPTVPSDAATGYATGCIFHHTDGGVGSALYINEGDAASADFNVLTNLAAAAAEDVTIADAGTYTSETEVEGALQEIYSFVTPMLDNTALTAQLTSITHTAPGTPDYALQNLVQNTGFGFATADEGNTVLSVILNLQTRVAELEAALVAAGILAAA